MVKTDKARSQKILNWLKTGRLKKEAAGMLMAAQEIALRTNSMNKKVDKQSVSSLCRLRRERKKTIMHVVEECNMPAQKQYHLWQRDRVGVIVYWVMWKRYGFSNAVEWYKHTPEKVLENDIKGYSRISLDRPTTNWSATKQKSELLTSRQEDSI